MAVAPAPFSSSACFSPSSSPQNPNETLENPLLGLRILSRRRNRPPSQLIPLAGDNKRFAKRRPRSVSGTYLSGVPSIRIATHVCTCIGWSQNGFQFRNHQPRSLKVRAIENSGDGQAPIVPIQLESPSGQLLLQIMQTHPHLLPSTIEQQLENLQTDRDAEKEKSPPASQDNPLYRRITEVKEKERQKALEEIIYCFIAHKFREKDISMIPPISSSSDPMYQVDSWPNQEHKLESLHSPDAQEMIQSHINLILGERSVGPLSTTLQISKLKLGKLYAASIMYGYFLKRVDERYQLERTMKTLPTRKKGQKIFDELKPNPLWDLESMVQISPDYEDDDDEDNFGDEGSKSYRLRSYVMYLDAETLQRYATIRSKESVSLIEKQTQALFGRPDIRVTEDGSLDALNDEVVGISFSGLTMLVLEAVAFGTFLWEAEGYVESRIKEGRGEVEMYIFMFFHLSTQILNPKILKYLFSSFWGNIKKTYLFLV